MGLATRIGQSAAPHRRTFSGARYSHGGQVLQVLLGEHELEGFAVAVYRPGEPVVMAGGYAAWSCGGLGSPITSVPGAMVVGSKGLVLLLDFGWLFASGAV